MGLALPRGSACTPVQFQSFLLGKSLLTPKGEKIRRKKTSNRSKSLTASVLFCREVALWDGHYLTWAKGAELAVLMGSGRCGGISDSMTPEVPSFLDSLTDHPDLLLPFLPHHLPLPSLSAQSCPKFSPSQVCCHLNMQKLDPPRFLKGCASLSASSTSLLQYKCGQR